MQKTCFVTSTTLPGGFGSERNHFGLYNRFEGIFFFEIPCHDDLADELVVRKYFTIEILP